MICPNCGESNANGARVCSRCGESLAKVRQKRKERNILILGIILVAVILAAGIGAMAAVSRLLSAEPEETSAPQKVTITATETPTPTPSPAPTEEPEATPEVTEAPEETGDAQVADEPLTASFTDVNRTQELKDLNYEKAVVAQAEATSTLYEMGMNTDPSAMSDGTTYSSWQEGVEGDGVGESATLTFDREYTLRYMTLRLGNWYASEYNNSYFTQNNRPKALTFEISGQQFTVEFPDEMIEYCVEFSREIKASSVKITLTSVYKGSDYDDTCINEIDFYGYSDKTPEERAAEEEQQQQEQQYYYYDPNAYGYDQTQTYGYDQTYGYGYDQTYGYGYDQTYGYGYDQTYGGTYGQTSGY